MTFENWIEGIVESEQPSDTIIAYYFGIFETTKGYNLYLTGSEEYDAEDSDWACNNDFEPSQKYFFLSEEYQGLKWQDALKRIIELLKDFTTTELFKKSFFSKVKAIATGFDDGDLILIR